MQIHGQLFLPSDLKPGEKRPTMVFMHGGSRRQMLLGWHYMDYYNNAYAMNQFLANQGYVVLSINYRSGIGYGLDFREAINYGVAGARVLNDVEGAGLYLRNRPEVDGSRIGLWGGSYGGYLTALGLSRASDLFKAGVDFHGVHDWNSAGRGLYCAGPPLAGNIGSGEQSRRTRLTWPVRVVADGFGENVALPGAIDSWRRRPECGFFGNGDACRSAARAGGLFRAIDSAG